MLKNVITICDGAGLTGGTEKVALTTTIELAKRGLNCLYFAGEGQTYSGLLDPNLNIHVVNLGLSDAYHTRPMELIRRFSWYPPAGQRLRAEIEKLGWKPEETVVHIHGFRRVLTGSVVEILDDMHFRTIFTLHDYGLVCPNTSFYNFPKSEICKLKPLSLACLTSQCTHKGWKMKAMQSQRGITLKLNSVAGSFWKFVCVSEFSKKILGPSLPPHINVDVIENPATDDTPYPRASPMRNSAFTFIGRLSPEKGVRIFARAAKIAGVEAVFVGTGPESEAIQKENPEARQLGWLDEEGVNAAICNSRAIVMPSLWYETAGLAVIEAVSRGIPAIVAETCAAVSYITPGATGMTYDTQNPESLAECLTKMTPDLAVEMGALAHQQYWENPLSKERYMAKILQLYDQLLNSGSARVLPDDHQIPPSQ